METQDIIDRAREALQQEPHAYDPEQLRQQIAGLKENLASVLLIVIEQQEGRRLA